MSISASLQQRGRPCRSACDVARPLDRDFRLRVKKKMMMTMMMMMMMMMASLMMILVTGGCGAGVVGVMMMMMMKKMMAAMLSVMMLAMTMVMSVARMTNDVSAMLLIGMSSLLLLLLLLWFPLSCFAGGSADRGPVVLVLVGLEAVVTVVPVEALTDVGLGLTRAASTRRCSRYNVEGNTFGDAVARPANLHFRNDVYSFCSQPCYHQVSALVLSAFFA